MERPTCPTFYLLRRYDDVVGWRLSDPSENRESLHWVPGDCIITIPGEDAPSRLDAGDALEEAREEIRLLRAMDKASCDWTVVRDDNTPERAEKAAAAHNARAALSAFDARKSGRSAAR
jgi:hypothetical protein